METVKAISKVIPLSKVTDDPSFSLSEGTISRLKSIANDEVINDLLLILTEEKSLLETKITIIIYVQVIFQNLKENQRVLLFTKLVELLDFPTDQINWKWQSRDFNVENSDSYKLKIRDYDLVKQNEFKLLSTYYLKLLEHILKSSNYKIRLIGNIANSDEEINELNFKLIKNLGYYYMRSTPWCSNFSNQKAISLLNNFKENNYYTKNDGENEEEKASENCNKFIENRIYKELIKNFSKLKENNKIHKSISKMGYRKNEVDRGVKPNYTLRDVDEFKKKQMSEYKREDWTKSEIKNVSLLLYFINTFIKRDSTEKYVKEHWSFLIPSILNILDDINCLIKIKGCELLSALLDKINECDTGALDKISHYDSGNYLIKTGVGPIFIDTITPILTYLPPFISAEESLVVVPIGFKIIIKILNKLYNYKKDKEKFQKKLIELINKEIIERLKYFNFASYKADNNDKIDATDNALKMILIYLDVLDEIIERYLDIQIVLIINDLLNGVVLQYLKNPVFLNCEIKSDTNLLIIEKLLIILIKIMIICHQRIEKRKYDILGGVLYFWSNFVNKKNDFINDFGEDKILGDDFRKIYEISTEKKDRAEDKKIKKIHNLVKDSMDVLAECCANKEQLKDDFKKIVECREEYRDVLPEL
ncbi:Tti2p ASCRUDRAFT_73204 [Ascoidea rubescens DSM 1968]|uniref:Uncharacterized protein n=1 Tax=Ascoidea rubescens DSM 1968 TaxID=1344418 RepID=A0A1D2VNZ0_9ASCO|nr:hypothetical protein ASCRUDRAFT_73204 [Ascoidea rubescens DSM 1968]ODV63316.1 hypothetical protein ASCRUDRAFT_73204 [Ascoidea rubescens DSM 1968]